MIKSIVLCGFCLIVLGACKNDKQKALTESMMHAKTDSIVGVKMQELNQQSMEDLDHRMAIEVKAKADSIVAAKTGKTDTNNKKQPQVKINKQMPIIPKKH